MLHDVVQADFSDHLRYDSLDAPGVRALDDGLPPQWRLPAPVDATVMQSLTEGLRVGTVLAIADRTVDPVMGRASYLHLTEVLETGVAALMSRDWPVYEALQGVAFVLNRIKWFDDYADLPDVVEFTEWCRIQAGRHRAGEPMTKWTE